MMTVAQLKQLNECEFITAYYTEVTTPTTFEQASVALIEKLIAQRQENESKISDLNEKMFYLEGRNGELMRALKPFSDKAKFPQSCVNRTQTTLEAPAQK